MLDPCFIQEHTLLATEFSRRSNSLPQDLCVICTQPRWRMTCAFKYADLCILHSGRTIDSGVSRPQCISMVNWVWHNIWRVISSPWKDLQNVLGFPPRENSVDKPEEWIKNCVDWLVEPVSHVNLDILNAHLALALPSMLDDPLRVGSHRTPNEFRALLPLDGPFRSIGSINFARKIMRILDKMCTSASPCLLQADRSVISPFSARTLARRYDFLHCQMVHRNFPAPVTSAISLTTVTEPIVTTVRLLHQRNRYPIRVYRRTSFAHGDRPPPRSASGAFLPSSIDEPLSEDDILVGAMSPSKKGLYKDGRHLYG
jgi:hypothetical protein